MRYNWAELPKEILELIGSRLKTRIDVFHFRRICTSWRSVVPVSYKKASTIYPPITLPPPVSATAVLSPVTICLLQDDSRAASCLIQVTESISGKMKIRNPLSKLSRRNKMFLSSCKSVDVSSLRIVEVSRGYRLKYQLYDQMSPMGRGVSVKKVVLFGNECGILVNYDEGKLSYLGFKDEDWTNLGSDEVKYDDIIDYNGLFYVVDNMGTVYWVDGKSMSLVQFSPPLFGLGQVKNLVVSEGELYVVDSYTDDEQATRMSRPVDSFEMVDMRVYRLDEEWGTWVDVKSLGDRVFVLGKGVCFSVSTKDLPGCERNCIYFIDTKIEDRYESTEFKRCFGRVFDIEDRRRMKTVDCFPSHQKLFSLIMNFPCTMFSSE